MFNQLSSLTSSYFEWQLLNRFPSDEFGKKKEKETESPFGSRMEPILASNSSSRSFPKIQQKLILLFGEPYFGDCQQSMEKRVTIDSSLSALMCPRCNLLLVILSATITFFAAVLTYSGRREEQGGLASCCYKKNDDITPSSGDVEENKSQNSEIDESKIDCHHHAKATNLPYMHKFFGEKFSPFILRKDVRIISWIFFGVYTCFALYGCCCLKVSLYFSLLYLCPFFELSPDYILSIAFFQIFSDIKVNSYKRRYQLFFQCLLYKAELFHWRNILDEYPEFDMFLAGIFRETCSLKIQWRPGVLVANPPSALSVLSIITYKRLTIDSTLSALGGLATSTPGRHCIPFLIDQRHTIAPSSMQTIGSALAMMAVISFFFLPDVQSVFLMTWSLLSISMGVCGGLAMLGSDLDSVSMGCIVMAIGLAVDYSVHICYRYHRSEYNRAADKVTIEDLSALNLKDTCGRNQLFSSLQVRDTLCSVAWPITQAVSSTLFGLASLPFVPAYLVRVFFQTVYLVNIIGITSFLGLTHALVWLPQLIAALDPCERIPLRTKVRKD
uniref:SSD domain-containing protein n=1 Tax=Heterorhabditis bacteriophora TaxID=37862 RepID=A0A1I7X5Z4_HETBA